MWTFRLAVLFLLLVTGACRAPAHSCIPTAKTAPGDFPFEPTRIEDPAGDNWWHPDSWAESFGLKSLHRDEVPKALDILSAEVREENESYVFEIETAGDVRETMEKYGAGVRYNITLGTWQPYEIVTTDEPHRALLISNAFKEVRVERYPDGTLHSAKMTSKIWVHAEVRVETRDHRLRLIVPKGAIDGAPDRETRGWFLSVGFLPPPAVPIPTTIDHFYFIGTVADSAKPPDSGCIWGPGMRWYSSTVPFPDDRGGQEPEDRGE